MTLARKHFERESAAIAAAASGTDGSTVEGTVYELALNQLAHAQRQLSQVQSIEKKVERKRELLPQFDAYVDGALAGGRGAQDDVLTTVLVWRVDIGDLAGALPIARYALEHGLRLPERYRRDVPTALAEEAADGAMLSLQAGTIADVDQLYEIEALTRDRDMPDEVRAKLHKALGHCLWRKAEANPAAADPVQLKAALKHLQGALQLHDKSGVKKDIEHLERAIKNAGTVG